MHPISRKRIVTEKLIAIITQIIAMNIIVFAASLLSIVAIKESIPLKEILLLHAAYLILQLELSFICFGISAFLSKGSIGIGIGLGTTIYFLNIVSNMTDSAKFLKYITPFGYCDGADIINEAKLDFCMISIGLAFAFIGIFLAYFKYNKKDIK